MDINNSLLSREQSLWLKGCLILLIVFGHNTILVSNQELFPYNELFTYLYSFHVYAFFFIRSMYNWKPLSCTDLKNNFSVLYKPYTICFFLAIAISLISGNGFAGVTKLLVGYFSGEKYLLKEATSMFFLWFLPTMFSFVVLLGLYAKRIKWLNISLLIASFVIVVVTSICGDSAIRHITVSGFLVAIRMFGLSIVCRWLFERCHKYKLYEIMIFMSAIAVTILFFVRIKWLLIPLIYGLIPFFMFQFIALLVYKIKHFGKTLLFMGKHSFEIYIVHVFVFHILFTCFKLLHVNQSIPLGILIYLLTLMLTLAIIYLISKWLPRVYYFVFSKHF